MRLLGLLIAAVAAQRLYHARPGARHERLYLDAARDLAIAAARQREAKGD